MNQQVEKQAYRIADFCLAFSIGRSKVYQEFTSGRLKFFKRGRMTLISKEAALAWLALCESESKDGRVA